mgnify:CR=1 FL=1
MATQDFCLMFCPDSEVKDPSQVRRRAFCFSKERKFLPAQQTMPHATQEPDGASCVSSLSVLLGCMRLTRWTRQTELVSAEQTIEFQACPHGFPAASPSELTISPSDIHIFEKNQIDGQRKWRESCHSEPG